MKKAKTGQFFFVLSSIVKVIYQNIYFFLLNRRKGIFHNESLLILHQLDLRTYLLSEIGTFAFFSFESAMSDLHTSHQIEFHQFVCKICAFYSIPIKILTQENAQKSFSTFCTQPPQSTPSLHNAHKVYVGFWQRQQQHYHSQSSWKMVRFLNFSMNVHSISYVSIMHRVILRRKGLQGVILNCQQTTQSTRQNS